MISLSQIRIIRKLRLKKYRKKSGLFVAEGQKLVKELLESNYSCKWLFGVPPLDDSRIVKISVQQMKLISSLKNPSPILGVFYLPSEKLIQTEIMQVALDRVKDPGNLGCIIRSCDWFGLNQIVCSKDSVDYYNSKVVQASMGSIARVDCYSTDLAKYLSNSNLPVFGISLTGVDLKQTLFKSPCILLFGNESTGIETSLRRYVNYWVKIPRYSPSSRIDSLNLSTSLGILLHELSNRDFPNSDSNQTNTS